MFIRPPKSLAAILAIGRVHHRSKKHLSLPIVNTWSPTEDLELVNTLQPFLNVKKELVMKVLQFVADGAPGGGTNHVIQLLTGLGANYENVLLTQEHTYLYNLTRSKRQRNLT